MSIPLGSLCEKENWFLLFRVDLFFKLAFLGVAFDSMTLKEWRIGKINNSVNEMKRTDLPHPPWLSSPALKGTGQKWLLLDLAGSAKPSQWLSSVQFSSVAQSCPTLRDPMNHSTPGLPVHHPLPEFTQTHVHRVHDAIQPSHPLSFAFPPAPNPSQHQSLFQWVNSSHEVAKVLEYQL